MTKILVECYVKEIEGEPSNPFHTKCSKGLVERGMLEIRPYSNGSKLKDALYITDLGKKKAEPFYKSFFK